MPSKLRETPYLGVAYIVLIAASLIAAVGVVAARHARWWLTPLAVGVCPLLAYVLSRSIGLPGAAGDIGNWLEPLGLASMFVEGAMVALITQAWITNRLGRAPATVTNPARPVLTTP